MRAPSNDPVILSGVRRARAKRVEGSAVAFLKTRLGTYPGLTRGMKIAQAHGTRCSRMLFARRDRPWRTIQRPGTPPDVHMRLRATAGRVQPRGLPGVGADAQ